MLARSSKVLYPRLFEIFSSIDHPNPASVLKVGSGNTGLITLRAAPYGIHMPGTALISQVTALNLHSDSVGKVLLLGSHFIAGKMEAPKN